MSVVSGVGWGGVGWGGVGWGNNACYKTHTQSTGGEVG